MIKQTAALLFSSLALASSLQAWEVDDTNAPDVWELDLTAATVVFKASANSVVIWELPNGTKRSSFTLAGGSENLIFNTLDALKYTMKPLWKDSKNKDHNNTWFNFKKDQEPCGIWENTAVRYSQGRWDGTIDWWNILGYTCLNPQWNKPIAEESHDTLS